MPVYCIVLQSKGTTRNAQLSDAIIAEGKPSAAAAATILRRSTVPEFIANYKYGTTVLHLFGYKTGKAGTENKHELPPPHDKTLLFGEAVLFAVTAGKYSNFNDGEYKKWYNAAFKGFEDLGGSDTDSDEDTVDEEEESEEEDNEIVEEAEEEEAVDVEEPVSDDEDDAPVQKPVPKISKAKKNLKKLPAWYATEELTAEPYKLL